MDIAELVNVRDQIRHGWDDQLYPVTLKAFEVLLHAIGYCYAKSHLRIKICGEVYTGNIEFWCQLYIGKELYIPFANLYLPEIVVISTYIGS